MPNTVGRRESEDNNYRRRWNRTRHTDERRNRERRRRRTRTRSLFKPEGARVLETMKRRSGRAFEDSEDKNTTEPRQWCEQPRSDGGKIEDKKGRKSWPFKKREEEVVEVDRKGRRRKPDTETAPAKPRCQNLCGKTNSKEGIGEGIQ